MNQWCCGRLNSCTSLDWVNPEALDRWSSRSATQPVIFSGAPLHQKIIASQAEYPFWFTIRFFPPTGIFDRNHSSPSQHRSALYVRSELPMNKLSKICEHLTPDFIHFIHPHTGTRPATHPPAFTIAVDRSWHSAPSWPPVNEAPAQIPPVGWFFKGR